MKRRILFLVLIGTFVACAASAQPITCPSPPSTSDVQSSLAIGAEASLLSRFLDMFGMNYNKRTAITQNLSQLPNADEIYKTLYFMSLKCQSIMAQRVPDGEKIRQWNDVIDQMANNRLPKRTEVIPPPPPGPRPVPNPGSKQLPPKRPEPWAADLIGSWKSDGWDPENNIPATILYTFNPDGSFLSIEGHYGESRGRFEYKRGHVLIEWENGTKEFAELLLTGTKNQFQYYIVDHTDQRHIGGKFIFQRVR